MFCSRSMRPEIETVAPEVNVSHFTPLGQRLLTTIINLYGGLHFAKIRREVDRPAIILRRRSATLPSVTRRSYPHYALDILVTRYGTVRIAYLHDGGSDTMECEREMLRTSRIYSSKTSKGSRTYSLLLEQPRLRVQNTITPQKGEDSPSSGSPVSGAPSLAVMPVPVSSSPLLPGRWS